MGETVSGHGVIDTEKNDDRTTRRYVIEMSNIDPNNSAEPSAAQLATVFADFIQAAANVNLKVEIEPVVPAP